VIRCSPQTTRTYLFHSHGTAGLSLRAIPILADSDEQAIREADVLRQGCPGEVRLFGRLIHEWPPTDAWLIQSFIARRRGEGEPREASSRQRPSALTNQPRRPRMIAPTE